MAEQVYAKSLADANAEAVSKSVRPLAGEVVLVGGRGTSMPRDWVSAVVLWADDAHCVIERHDRSGGRQRDLVPMHDVRAIAQSYNELADFRAHCERLLADRLKLVKARREATEVAQSLVWKKLDEIGMAVPVYRATDAEDA